MIYLDNLMFKGAITISMTKGDVLVGNALLKKKSAVIPVTIDSSHLGFIRNFKKVINKLEDGNKIYCCNGEAYIGYYERRGPYGEDEVFVSIANTTGFSIINMMFNLEKKLSKDNVKSLVLVKQGEYYINIGNKD